MPAGAGLRKLARRAAAALARVTPPDEAAYCYAYAHARLVGGCSPRGADMLAARQGPELLTDAVFLQGNHGDRQWAGGGMGEYMGRKTLSIARSMGYRGNGDTYVPSLARFPGDPEAFVDGRGSAKAVLKRRHARGERGWQGDGAIDVKPLESPPKRPAPPKREKLSTRLRRNLAQAGVNLD